MKSNVLTISINKPASEVYDFTINPQNTPLWISSVEVEETNETPVRVGTIYRNKGKNGFWNEYSVTQIEANKLFELTSKNGNYHVRYTYSIVDTSNSELEYFEWVDQGNLEEPFNDAVLGKLKSVIEGTEESQPSKLYKAVEAYITRSYTKDGVVNPSVKHLIRTAYWIKELEPNADDEIVIAALGHDIERAFRSAEGFEKINKSSKGMRDEEFLTEHQKVGGELMEKFLLENGATKDFASKVKGLIEKHEVGGTEEQNLLKDADSLSFFENNVDHFLSDKVKANGTEKVRDKFRWMFERITSEKAKEIAKPWYDDAMKRLES